VSLEDEVELIEDDAATSLSPWKLISVIARSWWKWRKSRRKEDGESAKPSEADD